MKTRIVVLVIGLFVILANFGAAPRISAQGRKPPVTIIMKDGFTIVGQAGREGEVMVDQASGKSVPVAKGFFMIDDPARRNIFSFRLLPNAEGSITENAPSTTDQVILVTPFTPMRTEAIEPFSHFTELPQFDDKWERTVKFQTFKGGTYTKQRITALTPQYFRVEAGRYRWSAMHLTKELGVDGLKKLLYSHPDLREKEGQADPVKRMKIFKFLMQAGYYEAAGQELDQFLKDAPKEEERIETARKTLAGLRNQELLEEIERAHKAGRHIWVQKKLASFNKEAAEETVLSKIRSLKAKYEAGEEAITQAKKFLADLPGKTNPGLHQQVFTEAAKVILAELNIDNHERLEPFTALAKQAERDRAQGRTPKETPGDLMGLAVSGWILGNGLAEAKVETGLKLWRTRQFVLDYQKTPLVGRRTQLLNDYERTKTDVIAFDELAQLISLLPPPEPEEKISTDVMPLQANTASAKRKTADYLVQLPPEYHHGRAFPVLVVLHQSNEKSVNAMNGWQDLAAQNGYILVAPEWAGQISKSGYNFSAEEHAVVLDSLRDLQRRFHVDPDRIFLAGRGQGGSMAFDVGLSHPDVFAGVVTLSAQPEYFARPYWTNAQHLPFYVVCGDLSGDGPKNIRRQFESWVASAAPAIYVEYKGRGQEWFDGELPIIFDWMNRKKRATGVPDLQKFSSMRATDNHFYWVSTEGILDRNVNDRATWSWTKIPATVQARIGESNTIQVSALGFHKVTIWLSKTMIDFEKPVTVNLNTGTVMKDRKLVPSLSTLLEDFYERGDRQRLFVARIDLRVTN